MYDIHDIESRSSIDAATSRAVRDGIGECLKDSFRHQPALPPKLQDLLEFLNRQELEQELEAGGNS